MASTNTDRQMEHTILHILPQQIHFIPLEAATVRNQYKCASHFTQTLHNIASPLTEIQLEAHKRHRRQRKK